VQNSAINSSFNFGENLLALKFRLAFSSNAGLFRRLAALVYDAFLLFAITLGYGALLLIVKVIFYGTEGIENIQPNAVAQWLSFYGLAYVLNGLLLYLLAQTGPNTGYESLAIKASTHRWLLPHPQAMY
jgi:hypothetical protein